MRKICVLTLLAVLTATAVFAQTTETIGRVAQSGSTFTVYNTRGSEITHFSSSGQTLMGFGKDFFVLRRNGTSTFTTYTPRCRQISTVSVGGATGCVVGPDSFTVQAGSQKTTYTKNCRRK
jgi:hypothetical protein